MHKLKQMKLKPGLAAFYTIQPGDGLSLFNKSGYCFTSSMKLLNCKNTENIR